MRFFLIFLTSFFILPVTSSANEGAGLLSSDLNGALPKALWQDQPRSEITALLKDLPADAPLRSLQQIKKNMLLSQYDVSSINNDVEPSPENNLLTLRLQKLIQMGLWEDAFRLYTATIDDPQDNDQLAQIAVLLSLYEKGIATACLEEKAFNGRFDTPAFWEQINDICNIEINSTPLSTADFAGSNLLQNIYDDEGFKISANKINELSTLSFLELALLSAKGRINYKNMILKRQTPPHLIKTFMKDSNLPDSERPNLDAIAVQQAILPNLPLENDNRDLENVYQNDLLRIIAEKLKRNQKISSQERQKLHQFAQAHPENYFYLSYLGLLQPPENEEKIPQKDILSGIGVLSINAEEKGDFLKSLLDKSHEFSNNLTTVYEKRSHADSDGGVITKRNKIDWLKEAVKNNHAGLSLLIMLSNIENSAWENSSVDTSGKKTFNVLKSLSKVGLIDQAHQIARERLANLMVLKEN